MSTRSSSECTLSCALRILLNLCSRGFAAQASAKALESIRTFSTEYLPFVEEDSIVSVDGDLIEKGHTD